MSDIVAFTLGVAFKSIAGYVVGDVLMKPIIKWAAEEYPSHVQPFKHYYRQHDGGPRECLACQSELA